MGLAGWLLPLGCPALGVPVLLLACGHSLSLLLGLGTGQSPGEGTPRTKGCLAGVLSERPSWPLPKPPTSSHMSKANEDQLAAPRSGPGQEL